MKPIVAEMLKIYRVKPLDFMGYKVTRENPYTYHHIKKKCDGGQVTIENGAILTLNAHEYLNIIEFKGANTYYALNEMFKIINRQGHAPTMEQYQIIDALLRMFEEEHRNDKNSKGKPLIKQKYLKREIIKNRR